MYSGRRETFTLVFEEKNVCILKNENVTNRRTEIDGEAFEPAEKKDGKRKFDWFPKGQEGRVSPHVENTQGQASAWSC